MTMCSELSPTIVPSFVVVDKEEAVVIQFKNDFTSSQEPITLDIFQDVGIKVLSISCVQLGSNAIKVTFPAFSKPGKIEVVLKVARECNPLFPKFEVRVASAVEAIYDRIPCSRVQDKKAILSCILSYITHQPSDDAEKARLQADTIICTLLSSMSEIPSWDLASFLCGDNKSNDNLLHFAARYRLDGMAEILARHIPENKDVFLQASSDKEAPLVIATNCRTKLINAGIEQLQASNGLQDCTYSRRDTANEAFILKALNDISHYLYKAKVTQDFQWSSYTGKLSLKVGDVVYVMQEKDDVCMVIADMSYGQFPKCVLQQISDQITQNVMVADDKNNVSISTRPIPKPRKTNGLLSPTGSENSSELGRNIYLADSNRCTCLEQNLSATPSNTSTLTSSEATVALSDSTLLVTGAPPPVSPRLRRVKTEGTSSLGLMIQTENVSQANLTMPITSTPPVSPRLKRPETDNVLPTVSPRQKRLQLENMNSSSSITMQADKTHPVSPRLKRLQADNSPMIRTESAPSLSPRLHRVQMEDTALGNSVTQADNTPPVSPRLIGLQLDNKPPIGPKPQTDFSTPPASPRFNRLKPPGSPRLN